MTIRQLVNRLEIIAKEQCDDDLPIYTNGEPHIEEMEICGVKVLDAQTVECLDTGDDLPLWPRRVFLKV